MDKFQGIKLPTSGFESCNLQDIEGGIVVIAIPVVLPSLLYAIGKWGLVVTGGVALGAIASTAIPPTNDGGVVIENDPIWGPDWTVTDYPTRRVITNNLPPSQKPDENNNNLFVPTDTRR
ncbi:MAG: hypothetical protein FWB72_04025 [Firmicutes bacterium]|nr:hypothetical protein [Bacillota bacterium]